ncbi:Protein of unknown function DUF4363 [Acididesulfobacillus acetoxydans]|uniref:DUF4363 family protein n=1 Tax=Acididesulfobacillus acetoxydans TaxID=1561005 RepID=A0A8S0XCX1_9FIRM|nr:DUF4363 family protein [Acididesulfobacillus acetoxydans]CAA7602906.1 Protein of unknown function DUF4363 [Acididesulfobacillus acetoxydans]CEJ05787.1 Domain of unknown function (DUF4363) [Acididesulfobacillus acetoxydans]
MRNLKIVAVVLVLLLGASFFSFSYISRSARTLTAQLGRVERSVQDGKWQEAGNELKTAQTSWEKTKYWWTILLNHQEIDNIDISMSRVQKYIETKGAVLSLGELSTLRMLVDHVSDNEAFNVRNIL